MTTGEDTHKPMAWNMLPPPKDKCQICAVAHPPEQPHNAQSLYYQMAFNGIVGRGPTWADAVAHCADDVKEHWERELRRLDAWSTPPDGEHPVKHHGLD